MAESGNSGCGCTTFILFIIMIVLIVMCSKMNDDNEEKSKTSIELVYPDGTKEKIQ